MILSLSESKLAQKMMTRVLVGFASIRSKLNAPPKCTQVVVGPVDQNVSEFDNSGTKHCDCSKINVPLERI